MYTTKSHGINGEERYRIILPINYSLYLTESDYKQMMSNIFKGLPFLVDESGDHRCKKWETNKNAKVFSNSGSLFDVLPYIPKTAKDEERQTKLLEQSNLDNLERWIINNTGDGNRNVQMHKYAMVLCDAGKNFMQVQELVFSLNKKLNGSLDEAELYSTVMTSVAKKLGL
jgi:hypothetical protein